MAVLAFGEFEIDAASLELRRAGVPVAIQPKVFRLLLHLARHRERVVSSDELLRAIWPDEVVTPASIKRAIKGAREALGETGQGQSSIRTARGHGYQFVADVRESPAVTVSRAAFAATPQHATAPRDVYIERDALRDAVERAWLDAERGRGHALLLWGEAGVGKSRALSVLAEYARQRSAITWIGRGADAEGAPPYWPFITIVRDALHAQADRATLLECMGDGAADLAQALPPLRSLLAIEADAPSIDNAAARFRFFDSMLHFLRRVAQLRPLLLVVDDVPLADGPTLQLLSFLSRHIDGSRILLAGSARKGWLGRDSQFQAAHGISVDRHTHCIEVEGFVALEVAQFIESHTGVPAPPALVSELAQQTAGNPLLLTHMLRLSRPKNGGSGPDWNALKTFAVDPGWQGAIERHLCELSAATRACLRAAALLGRSFAPGFLGLLLDATATQLTECLAEASAQGLVCDAGDASGQMRFTHGLVRDALVADTDVAIRVRLHAAAARVLAARYENGGAEAAEVAHHFFEADDNREALHYTLLAAKSAREHLGADAAVAHYDRALALLERLEQTPVDQAQLEPAPLDPPLMAAILLDKGRALAESGDIDAARTVLFQAANRAREQGSAAGTRVLARAALAIAPPLEGVLDEALLELLREALERLEHLDSDDELRPRVLAALSKAMCHGRDLALRRELGHAAVLAARKLRDPHTRALALRHCHEALSEPEDVATRCELTREITAIARASSDPTILLRACTAQLQDALDLGDMQTVLVALTTLEQLAERVREPFFRWFAKSYRAMHAWVEGRMESALQLAEEALRLGSSVGVAAARHAYLVQASACLRVLGRSEEGRALVYEAAARFPAPSGWRVTSALCELEAGRADAAHKIFVDVMATGIDTLRKDAFVLSTLCPLAELCGFVGDAASAELLYATLLPYAEQCGTVAFGIVTYGPIPRFLGILAARQQKYALAARHFDVAWERAQRMASPMLSCGVAYATAYSLVRDDVPSQYRQGGLARLADAHDLARKHGLRAFEVACEALQPRSHKLQAVGSTRRRA